MTEKLQIYKCEKCGNVIQVLLSGNGELVCCGEVMRLQELQREHSDIGEKHAPTFDVSENDNYIQVKNHPMKKEHYIQFVEVYKKDKSQMCIKYFSPEEDVIYKNMCKCNDIDASAFCNIHGLWGTNDNR